MKRILYGVLCIDGNGAPAVVNGGPGFYSQEGWIASHDRGSRIFTESKEEALTLKKRQEGLKLHNTRFELIAMVCEAQS